MFNFGIIAFEQALLLLPLIIGVYLSYRLAGITDLTVDGSYCLGACIYARFYELGPISAILLSTLAGALVGSLVSFMQHRKAMSDLMAGILASFMLYSVNLQILGRPNISLLGKMSLLTLLQKQDWFTIVLFISIVVVLGIIAILKTEFGLKIRAFRSNPDQLKALGFNPEVYRTSILAISNALASLAGSIAAQVNGFADINMGFGIAITAIAAVLIGKQLLGDNLLFSPGRGIASCFIGIFSYFLLMNVILKLGINPANIKFILGGVLCLVLRKRAAVT